MTIQDDIEQFLAKEYGDFLHIMTVQSKKKDIVYLDYYRCLDGHPTVQMVIRPPIEHHVKTKVSKDFRNFPISFFLYDKETQLSFGLHSEIFLDDNWQENLGHCIDTAEQRAYDSHCPKCGCWLQVKYNLKGQKFMGCSGYPPCDYTTSILKNTLIDDTI